MEATLSEPILAMPLSQFSVSASFKAMFFPVVMYECERWTVKKAERRKIDALNSSVGEDSWESLGLQRDPTSPS